MRKQMAELEEIITEALEGLDGNMVTLDFLEKIHGTLSREIDLESGGKIWRVTAKSNSGVAVRIDIPVSCVQSVVASRDGHIIYMLPYPRRYGVSGGW